MEPEFWHQRWQENRIGFHQDIINPYLEQYWPQLGVKAPARIFVPLSGKSRDMSWLLEQGYQVEGVELSALAVAAFFEEQGIEHEKTRIGEWWCWEGEKIRLWCGDFFALTRDLVGALDAVYDRASLIALPAAMRPRYVRHLSQLAGACPQLLITLDYPQAQMDGPPFAVTPGEVRQLYAAQYENTESVWQADALAGNPHLQERGVTRLTEAVYLLRPRRG